MKLKEILFCFCPCFYSKYYIDNYKVNLKINEQIKKDARNVMNEYTVLLLGMYIYY